MGWDGPMTHRQFCTWQEWLAEDETAPDLTDLYIMRLTHEVRHVLAKKQPPFRLKDYLLSFGKPAPPRRPSEMTEEERREAAKGLTAEGRQAGQARMTMEATVVRVDRAGNILPGSPNPYGVKNLNELETHGKPD